MLRSVKYGLYAAVLAGVVGARSPGSRSTRPSPRGRRPAPTVHTTAADVSGVLSSAGYHVGAHDLVAPRPDAKVHDGSTIVYKRGRLLHLTVDGAPQTSGPPPRPCSQALADLGYPTATFTSVSRAKRLPLDPTDIACARQDRHPRRAAARRTHGDHDRPHRGRPAARPGHPARHHDWLSVPVVRRRSATTSRSCSRRIARSTTTAVQATAVPDEVDPGPDAAQGRDHGRHRRARAAPRASPTWSSTSTACSRPRNAVGRRPCCRPPITQVQKVGTAPLPPVDHARPARRSAYATHRSWRSCGWGEDQMSCLITMWDHESGWRYNADQPAAARTASRRRCPASKMGLAGWQTDPRDADRLGPGLHHRPLRHAVRRW